MLYRIFLPCLALVALLLAPLQPAYSDERRISLIRDTEIEAAILAYATPLFEAAHLDPRAVRIYLVNDRQINAFVAGGQNLFLNTGLLMRSDDAGQVIGVIAHEVGHIEGGHLARIHDALKRGTAETIAAIVLGAAAAVAGRPDLGTAIALGGQDIAMRNFLQYTRTQEGAADAAAMRYLDVTGQSARPLLTFFETLSGQELLSPTRQDPYLRTHPLTRDRILALSEFVGHSRFSEVPLRGEYARLYRRLKAKLHAFLDDPSLVARRYPPADVSLEAHYARAIALHRTHRFAEALAAIEELLVESPDDPYFLELKGQMLFETGRPAQAIGPYRRASALLPDAPLIHIDLARALLALNETAALGEATEHLRAAVLREPNRPFAWRQLAIAQGRGGQMGESALSLAEEAVLLGKKPEARFQAGKAAATLPQGSPGWLRAQDILRAIEQEREKDGDR